MLWSQLLLVLCTSMKDQCLIVQVLQKKSVQVLYLLTSNSHDEYGDSKQTDKAVFDIATRFTLMTRAQMHNLHMLRTTESRLWNGVAESTNTGKEHGRKFRIPKPLAAAPNASSPPKGSKNPQQHQVLESLERLS